MPAVKLGDGTVTITLDGREQTLKPTFLAAQTLSRASGGIMGNIERVVKMDLDTIVNVISLGLGYGASRKPPKDIAEQIWRAGLTDDSGGIVQACVLYLRMLSNGGRPIDDSEDEEKGGDRPN